MQGACRGSVYYDYLSQGKLTCSFLSSCHLKHEKNFKLSPSGSCGCLIADIPLISKEADNPEQMHGSVGP